jgi:hypothetical protein
VIALASTWEAKMRKISVLAAIVWAFSPVTWGENPKGVPSHFIELTGFVKSASCSSLVSAPSVRLILAGVENEYSLSSHKCLSLEDKLDEARDERNCGAGKVMVAVEVDTSALKVTKILDAKVTVTGKCY